jgi:hypothetical protein
MDGFIVKKADRTERGDNRLALRLYNKSLCLKQPKHTWLSSPSVTPYSSSEVVAVPALPGSPSTCVISITDLISILGGRWCRRG